MLLAVGVFCSCGNPAPTVDTTDDGQASAQSRLDQADRTCTVALRSAARVTKNGGFETNCVSGRCWFVWSGSLDVSTEAVAAGGGAFVLFHNQGQASWSQVEATATTGAPAGFVRYAFRLDHDTMETGLSNTGIARTKIDVAPFWQTSTGHRLFDKQRGQGDFDNYVLSADNQFTVSDDAAVCPARATVSAELDFRAGWATERHGALVAGSTVTVNYALERLPDCRGTHNGFPAWDVRAFVRFLPSGRVVDGTVRGFDGPSPSNASAHAVPFAFTLPVGTTRVELWFSNFTGAGSSCQAWDSNFDANYAFDVVARAPNPVTWLGNPGSSFSRDCTRRDGVADSVVLDSYVQQRACAFVEIDTYVAALTDSATEAPDSVFARAVVSLDGQALSPVWLTPSGRVGNNARYRFTVPKSDLFYGPKWSTYAYTLQTSTDGVAWVSDVTRVITRDPSFCNPAWPSCDL